MLIVKGYNWKMVVFKRVEYYWLLAPLFCLISSLAFSQNLPTISGKVLDGVTGQPISDAHVYINNTTRGAVTDSLGQFTLPIATSKSIDVVVSVLGYQVLRSTLNLTKPQTLIVFRLIPAVHVLSEVEINAKQQQRGKRWKNNYEQFRLALLGTSSNANNCEILNPEVLSFENVVDLSRNIILLKARAGSPLEIVNHALGYRVFVELVKFEFSTAFYAIRTSNRFDTLSPTSSKERERWRINRLNTYGGSLTHLFRSMSEGRQWEEGFRIATATKLSNIPISAITSYHNVGFEKNDTLRYRNVSRDSSGNYFHLFPKGVYQIVYNKKIVKKEFRTLRDFPFPVSWIVVSGSSLDVDDLAAPLQPDSLGLAGYFDSQRIGDLLPLDYYPETLPIDEETVKEKRINNGSTTCVLEGIITDEAGNPLEGAEVFIHNGLTQTVTDSLGQYFMDLAPGIYDIGYFYGGMTAVKKTVTAPVGESVALHVMLFPQLPAVISEPDNKEVLVSLFERNLLDKSKIHLGVERITNPGVLQFNVGKNKEIDIYATAPLVLESSKLGYRWICYLNKARLSRTKNKYELEFDGPIKMEQLSTEKKLMSWYWKMKRYDQYEGSFNHFIVALTEGRLQDEGFNIYKSRDGESIKRRMHIKNAMSYLKDLQPDSLLSLDSGLLYLNTPAGLEIHSTQNEKRTRLYKGYDAFVFRVGKEISRVAISPNGYTATPGLNLESTWPSFLAPFPADFQPPYDITSDKSILFAMDKDQLVAIRDKQEKAYVQTDRAYYYAGDTIWFKVYLKYKQHKLRDSLSKVIYVDLMKGPDTLVTTRVLKIENGVAWGDIGLGILQPGEYFLRAYTQWMRNFDEYYWRHVPIISSEYSVVSSWRDTIADSNAIDVKIAFDKIQYGPREVVHMSLHLRDTTSSVGEASLSVSITDMSAVKELKNEPTIRSLIGSFKADRTNILRIKYPIEEGITLKGRIIGRSENNSIFAYLKGDQSPIIANLKDNQFEFLLDFFDTTSIVIKALNDDVIMPGIELGAGDKIETSTTAPMLAYELVKNESEFQVLDFSGKGVRLLDEVVVKARRISVPNMPNTVTQSRFGPPTLLYNNITNPALIDAARKSNDPVSFLMAAIPDFAPTAELIRNGNQLIWDNGAVSTTQSKLGYLRKLYSVMLDGVIVEYDQVRSIPTSMISQIEVYRDRSIVSLYTENMVPLPANFYRYQIRGYDTRSIFKVPSLKDSSVDYRSTLYWNPSITTNSDGVAHFNFRTSDLSGNYRIIIEGMTNDGRPIRHQEVFKVD